MHKQHRLTGKEPFASIRREGRSLVHPYLVISLLPNGLEYSRFGFVVGRRIGKAVKRNQVKRRMREAVWLRVREGKVAVGYDVVLIARYPIQEASFQQVDQVVGLLLSRAGLVSGTL